MKTTLRPLQSLRRLPSSFEQLGSCDGCIYWEFKKEFDIGLRDFRLKRKWFAKTLKAFGNCGFQALINGRVVGFVQYAPLDLYTGRYLDFPAHPSEDAIFISCLHVRDVKSRSKGVADLLLKAAINDLRSRGFRVIEAIARKGSANNPAGPVELYSNTASESCMTIRTFHE